MVKIESYKNWTWQRIVDEAILPDCAGRNDVNYDNFRNWLLTKHYVKKYSLRGKIWLHLYLVYDSVSQRDLDHVFIICGKEGLGKSTLMLILAWILDPSFCYDDMIKTIKEFSDKVRYDPKFKSWGIDEGMNFASGDKRFDWQVKMFIELITKVRQKNCFTFVCIPKFESLHTYLRDHRLGTLVIIPTRKLNGAKNNNKGWRELRVFNQNAIHKLIEKRRRDRKSANLVKLGPHYMFYSDFNGKTWPEVPGFDRDKYLEFKKEDIELTCKEIDRRWPSYEKEQYVNTAEAAQRLGIAVNTVLNWIKDKKLEAYRVGKQWKVRVESIEAALKSKTPP